MPDVRGVRHRDAEVNGVRLHVAEAGAGEPILLLHGWPQHWWSGREVIGPLAEPYHVICPDIRGLGWSDGSAKGYDLNTLADDVVGVVDALELEQVNLVGHDWGSIIGFAACLRSPDRFRRFMALGSIHFWTADGLRFESLRRPWHIYVLAIAKTATTRTRLPERALHRWRHVGAFTPEETSSYLESLRQPASVNATLRYYRHIVFRAIPHYWVHYRDVRLTVPTRHINGQQDPFLIGLADTAGKYADDYSFELLPDCGHFIPEEAPDRLLERIASFMPC